MSINVLFSQFSHSLFFVYDAWPNLILYFQMVWITVNIIKRRHTHKKFKKILFGDNTNYEWIDINNRNTEKRSGRGIFFKKTEKRNTRRVFISCVHRIMFIVQNVWFFISFDFLLLLSSCWWCCFCLLLQIQCIYECFLLRRKFARQWSNHRAG